MLTGGFMTIALFMLAFYLLFALVWMFISTIADIFRRHDLSGLAKAGWIVLLFVAPFLGILIYVVVKPASLR